MDKRGDLECCTRYPQRVAGLRIGIRKRASAAMDEEMPWRAWTSEAGTCAGRTRVTERTWGIVRESSSHAGKAVAGNVALPYHHAVH